LTIRTLREQERLGGLPKKGDNPLGLSEYERKRLDEACSLLNAELTAGKPEDLVKNFKALYDRLAPLDKFDGDKKTVRNTLLQAASFAMKYINDDDKTFTTVARWMRIDGDGKELDLTNWEAYYKKWTDALTALDDDKDIEKGAMRKAAFRDFIKAYFDEANRRVQNPDDVKSGRPAGAPNGLYIALKSTVTRDDLNEIKRQMKEEAANEKERKEKAEREKKK
jgi:hypothetical protein